MVEALRAPDGSWTQLQANSPKGQPVAIFVDRNRSFAQQPRYWHITRLAKALRIAHPETAFTSQRFRATIIGEWCEVATVHFVEATRGVSLEWHSSGVDAVRVDTGVVETENKKAVEFGGPLRERMRG